MLIQHGNPTKAGIYLLLCVVDGVLEYHVRPGERLFLHQRFGIGNNQKAVVLLAVCLVPIVAKDILLAVAQVKGHAVIAQFGTVCPCIDFIFHLPLWVDKSQESVFQCIGASTQYHHSVGIGITGKSRRRIVVYVFIVRFPRSCAGSFHTVITTSCQQQAAH